jgi:hypothetical protein
MKSYGSFYFLFSVYELGLFDSLAVWQFFGVGASGTIAP